MTYIKRKAGLAASQANGGEKNGNIGFKQTNV